MRMLTVAVAVLVALSRPAWAADPDTEIARRHFEVGTAHYEAGRFAEAIKSFDAARRAKALPAFEFNIARCYDRLGMLAEAIAAYERYRRAILDADEIAAVDRRVVELRARLGAAPAAVAVAPAPPPRGKHRAVFLGLGLSTLGVGLVALGVGAYFSSEAVGNADAVTRSFAAGGAWNPDALARQDAGQRAEVASGVLYGVGGAAVLGGAVLTALGARRSGAGRAALLPLQGGALASFTCDF